MIEGLEPGAHAAKYDDLVVQRDAGWPQTAIDGIVVVKKPAHLGIVHDGEQHVQRARGPYLTFVVHEFVEHYVFHRTTTVRSNADVVRVVAFEGTVQHQTERNSSKGREQHPKKTKNPPQKKGGDEFFFGGLQTKREMATAEYIEFYESNLSSSPCTCVNNNRDQPDQSTRSVCEMKNISEGLGACDCPDKVAESIKEAATILRRHAAEKDAFAKATHDTTGLSLSGIHNQKTVEKALRDMCGTFQTATYTSRKAIENMCSPQIVGTDKIEYNKYMNTVKTQNVASATNFCIMNVLKTIDTEVGDAQPKEVALPLDCKFIGNTETCEGSEIDYTTNLATHGKTLFESRSKLCCHSKRAPPIPAPGKAKRDDEMAAFEAVVSDTNVDTGFDAQYYQLCMAQMPKNVNGEGPTMKALADDTTANVNGTVSADDRKKAGFGDTSFDKYFDSGQYFTARIGPDDDGLVQTKGSLKIKEEEVYVCARSGPPCRHYDSSLSPTFVGNACFRRRAAS